MDEETLLIPRNDHSELEDLLRKCELHIKQLELKHNRTSKEVQDNPITLLPNYKFSPRDLFIAFVTRSIHQTKSLDVICRHWAPDLVRRGRGRTDALVDIQSVQSYLWASRDRPR